MSVTTTKKIKISVFVQAYRENCNKADLSPDEISGISFEKEFFEPSRQVAADTSEYKIVPDGYFACNLLHVGRDKILPVALNNSGKKKIVSPNYVVFRFFENDDLLKEYFYLQLLSEELDRYFAFQTASSICDGLSWSKFISAEIEVPSVEIQRKYIEVFRAFNENIKATEKVIEILENISEILILQAGSKCETKLLGDYIKISKQSNSDLKYSLNDLKGLAADKTFIESKSNLAKVNLERALIVEPKDFVFAAVTSRNSERFSVAFNSSDETFIVSHRYFVFKVNNSELNERFLYAFFNQKEFDRYVRFNSWGTSRENFYSKELKEIEIVIPPLSVQKQIADIFDICTKQREELREMKKLKKQVCRVLTRLAKEEACSKVGDKSVNSENL